MKVDKIDELYEDIMALTVDECHLRWAKEVLEVVASHLIPLLVEIKATIDENPSEAVKLTDRIIRRLYGVKHGVLWNGRNGKTG